MLGLCFFIIDFHNPHSCFGSLLEVWVTDGGVFEATVLGKSSDLSVSDVV